MHDLIIRGGTVVDGSGTEAMTADITIDAGIIVGVGQSEDRARRVLDADGLLVTPGFVDVHTHYDGQATWDPHLTPSCWHGVTTAVLGNCGVGFAPVRPDGHERLVELMEGVEDIPGTALHEGINWEWESFPEYLDALDRIPRALDIGVQVPHAALRAYVMGERAQDDATTDDIDKMRSLLLQALDEGALGFSTGRTSGHRDSRGNPVPGTFAAEIEIEALFGALAESGHGVFQVVPAGIGGAEGIDPEGSMDRELDWMLRLARSAPVPFTFLVLQSRNDPDGWRRWFDGAHKANSEGARARPQVGSRCFGALMGHQSGLNPFRYSELYQQLAVLDLSERIVHLREADVRSRILAEAPEAGRNAMALDRLGRSTFNRLFPLGRSLNYEPEADQSVAAIAERTAQDPWALVYDLMLEADGREFLLLPLANFGGGSYEGLYEMMSDPLSVQGLGDGGAHSAIICDASMTTYLLTHWVRDRTRGPRIPLASAIRRLTKDAADLYGLTDRGVLRPGMRADVNLIDFDALALGYPEQVSDLPAGAGRLIQRSAGYVATLVAGQVVVDCGELTDERPGHVVRQPKRGLWAA